MTGYEVYKTYIAIKLHFTNDLYDYFACGGRIKANHSSYLKRNDQYFFDYLAKNGGNEEDIKMKFVLYYVNERNLYIKDVVREYRKPQNYFLQWLGYIEGFPYTAIQQLENIRNSSLKTGSIIDAFSSPTIFEKYLEREIMPETFILFDSFFGISKMLKSNLLWKEEKKVLTKYYPFVKEKLSAHITKEQKEKILKVFNLFKGE
jgi:hypothetical protein